MHIVTTTRALQLAAVALAAALLVEGGVPASGTGPESPGRICPPQWRIHKFHNLCYDSATIHYNRPNCNCVPASICTAADTEPAWVNVQLCGKKGGVCCFNFKVEEYPIYDIAYNRQLCGQSFYSGPVTPGEAQISEWPSIVAILIVTAGRTWSPSEELVATGVIIHWRVVLTTAHTLAGIRAKKIKVRAWQFDSQNATQYYKNKDVLVQRILRHQRYERPTLAYDVALLFLVKPITNDIACVASSLLQPGTECHVTGWGQRSLGGAHATRLKKVPVPIVHQVQCQDALSHTRYGRVRLHQSTVCAGGRAGEDACRGDGGAPLLCPQGTNNRGKSRYVVVGLVSWGIGCGSAGVPGVYTDVASLFQWITDIIKLYGFDPSKTDSGDIFLYA